VYMLLGAEHHRAAVAGETPGVPAEA
jgi:hypothetical protein